MSEKWVGRTVVVVFGVNIVAIIAAIWSGYNMGALTHRFEERQAITFISSNQLGATALTAWLIYLLSETFDLDARGPGEGKIFWLLSALGFLYLMLDETFQFHEGMDTSFARLFGIQDDPMLDGAPTALYGIAAAVLCYRYRREITRFPATLRLFVLGGIFLALTSFLNMGMASSVQIVAEEAAKLLGVASFFLGHLAVFAGTVRRIRSLADSPIT